MENNDQATFWLITDKYINKTFYGNHIMTYCSMVYSFKKQT